MWQQNMPAGHLKGECTLHQILISSLFFKKTSCWPFSLRSDMKFQKLSFFRFMVSAKSASLSCISLLQLTIRRCTDHSESHGDLWTYWPALMPSGHPHSPTLCRYRLLGLDVAAENSVPPRKLGGNLQLNGENIDRDVRMKSHQRVCCFTCQDIINV